MSKLGMQGPFILDFEAIDKVVTSKSPGNYALGKNNEAGVFLVNYVGRSDVDVNDRLKSWVNQSTNSLFKFSNATSPKAAFEKECVNYHDFSPPANDNHPNRPENSNWTCPKCNVFG